MPLHGGYFNQKCSSRDANSIDNRVIYSRQQLYGLKWKSSLPSFLFQYLQSLGLLKTRRCRGGKSVIRYPCYNIKTIISHTNNATTIKASRVGRCLENLAPVNRYPLLLPSSTPLNFCLFNTRSINNKTLQIKDYIIDERVDLQVITEKWLKPDESSDFSSRDICSKGYIHVPLPSLSHSSQK